MEPGDLDWGELFARYRPLALRVAAGVVGEPQGAEDVVQEAARAVLERARRGTAFASVEHARNYLLKAVRNLAVERLRDPAHGRSRPLEEATEVGAPGDGPWRAAAEAEEAVRRSEHLRLLDGWIEGLRPPEREALRLRYGEGLTLREMSERTGVALSTLGERVQAGLGKIRRKAGRRGILP